MRRYLLVVILSLFGATCLAQINPTEVLQRDSLIKYGKLKNGMTYYIVHNDKPKDRAEYYLLTDVGAIQENSDQKGLAHFLEHMCFNGTKNLPGKMLIDYFESIGAGFGSNLNASTGVESTMYMLNNIPTTRNGIIDTALLVLHDYSGFVMNDPKEIDKERGVIIEEWRTRRNSNWRVYEETLQYIYKGSKYADCNIIGTKEGLETFSAEQLVSFYKSWYRPDLQAVVIVGDINPDEIYLKLEKLFEDVQIPQNVPTKEQFFIPNNEEPIVGIITDPELRVSEVDLYIKSEPLPKEMRGTGIGLLNNLVRSVIFLILDERYSDIYSKQNSPFLQAAANYTMLTQTLESFAITAFSKDNEALTAFEAALIEFERAKRFGFTQGEYERAVTNILSNLEINANNKFDRQNAEIVNDIRYDFFNGEIATDPVYLYELAKQYFEAIDVSLVNQLISTIDYSRNAVLVYSAPEKEGLTHPTEDDFVKILKKVPELELENTFIEELEEDLMDPNMLNGSKIISEKLGKFETTEWVLSNGIRVFVRPSTLKKDEVFMDISVDGGKSIFSEEEVISLNNEFTSFIEMSGVSSFSHTVLKKMLAGNTADIVPYINELTYGFSAECTPKDIETMLQLAYLYCVEPRLEKDEFDPIFNQIETILPNLINDPSFKLSEEFYKTAYNSPRKQMINMEMLSKFKFDTLVNCYKKLFGNMAGASVYITGNVNLEELKPLVEKYIGSLPVGNEAHTYVDNDLEIVKGRNENRFLTKMETPKTTVLMAYSGDLDYSLENTYYLEALKYILDLVYTSTIREEEGATYGVGTSCSLSIRPKQQVVFMVQFDTNNDVYEKMVALVKEGLENIANGGVTDEQLSKAKENLLKNIPEMRIDNSYWSNVILMYNKFEVDIDSRSEEIINGLSALKLKEIVKTILNQGNLVTVIMNPTE